MMSRKETDKQQIIADNDQLLNYFATSVGSADDVALKKNRHEVPCE